MRHEARWRAAAVAALVAVIALQAQPADAEPEFAVAESRAPRLAIVIVVDQLRRDRLSASLPGGLGRLAREGLVFAKASLAHAASETCPGHASIATGRHPGPAGAPANQFVDAATGTVRYCVEDDVKTAAVLGASIPTGRSPRKLRADTLGDWLDRADAESKVFAVSGKDRSAIVLGGQHPEGAFWLGDAGAVAFTTSRYYAAELPRWVAEWNARAPVLSTLPAKWEHAVTPEQLGSARPDDYAHENGDHSRVSGHPVASGAADTVLGNVYVSPWVDTLTLDFAFALLAHHALGDDDAPDLLAISLSGTDTVGHNYGPESHEAYDALRRLDADLGEFLAAVERRVGRDRVVVALTSDHGVLPIPEWLEETGRATCPVATGRVALDPLRRNLDRHLSKTLGRGWLRLWSGTWVNHAGLQLTIDRARAAKERRSVEEISAAAKKWLEQQPGIARAWTAADLEASADDMAAAYRRSFDPERSGDIVVQPDEGCLFSTYSSGTSHGAPYAYDRDVPLVLSGPGIQAGRSDVEAATVDLAPTLAALLGIAAPDDLDGRVLPLSWGPGGVEPGAPVGETAD